MSSPSGASSERAFELLLQALEIPPAERPAWLHEASDGDSGLRRQVEGMLALEDDAEAFLPRSQAIVQAVRQDLENGARIGPYRIVGHLADGGMSSVYEARREDDFEKRVAIKVIHTHLVSEATVRRFHAERQILARLEHPGIARLLDGGTTDDGRPYLVMELVEGVPIDRYCEEHGLTVPQRLELFLPVLEALAFAHRNLVVHRDLKPGNLLVTADGTPKLLDFGIAKLLDEQAEAAVTHLSERPMTPRYSSPEQILGEAITTASDVYACGVLLYQMLTGRLPCELDGCGREEITRRIREREALRASVLVRRIDEIETATGTTRWTPESVSRTRGVEPQRLRRQLAGDVDAILLKALRKTPEHRYASAAELADDIERHLRGETVGARRGTWLYRSSRFVRRHRLALAAAAVLLLVIGVAVTRELRRLRAEGERARRFAAALEQLVTLADPDAGELSARSLLDSARERLSDLEGSPELQLELLDALGRIHRKRGSFREARELFSESLKIWRRTQPGVHRRLALRLNNLASLHLELGEPDRAEPLYREALTMLDRLGQSESAEAVIYLNNLASVLLDRGAPGEAEELYRRGLTIREATLEPDDPKISNSLRSLAAAHRLHGNPTAAEPLLRRALAIRRQAYGDDHPAVASVLDLLASVRLDLGDTHQAGRLLDEALLILRQRRGWEHPSTAWSERNLAAVALAEGEIETARVLITRARESLLASRPATDWRFADLDSLLGEVLIGEGRLAEAAVCLRSSGQQLEAARPGSVYARHAQQRLARLEAMPGAS